MWNNFTSGSLICSQPAFAGCEMLDSIFERNRSECFREETIPLTRL